LIVASKPSVLEAVNLSFPSGLAAGVGMRPELNAVIIGASSAIGGAIALALASTGAALCLVGRNATRLESIAAKVSPMARAVLVCEADLTVESAMAELARQLQDKFASIDILVHCAGTFSTGRIESTDVSELDHLYKTNVRLPFVLTKILLPLLRSRPGQIVFINSSQGVEARANTGLYASTQHALKAFADALRKEVNAEGIRVLSVYLGRTATSRMEALYRAEGRSYEPELLLQSEDVAQIVMASLQLPRTAEVTDLHIRPLIKSY
jgi:NADP-dependent 3-hydroxy acid dehydrogenase YdfG